MADLNALEGMHQKYTTFKNNIFTSRQQHLKSKFSEGTEIEIQSSSPESGISELKKRRPSIRAAEQYQVFFEQF